MGYKHVFLIGRVVDSPSTSPFVQLTIRSVNFQWQRGNQIGKGSFGKVYTCVNTNSGKILAMKEVGGCVMRLISIIVVDVIADFVSTT